MAIRETAFYIQAEPYYQAPIQTPSGVMWLRNDTYGKGFFGASRGNGKRRHKGLDFLVAVGQPVTASKSGRVVFAAEEKGYGLCVYIAHPDGLSTRYAHLSAINVRAGQWVTQKTVLGKSGKTGNAAGPRIAAHLHFEIRREDAALNPAKGLFDPALKILSPKNTG